jgi:ABC-type multidrug transport system ATPase subunit
MWAEIDRLATGEQVTVLLTTHYLDEADRLAERLAIVDHGRIVVEGTPDELKDAMEDVDSERRPSLDDVYLRYATRRHEEVAA